MPKEDDQVAVADDDLGHMTGLVEYKGNRRWQLEDG